MLVRDGGLPRVSSDNDIIAPLLRRQKVGQRDSHYHVMLDIDIYKFHASQIVRLLDIRRDQCLGIPLLAYR